MDPIILVPGLGSDATVWERTVAALGPDYDCRIADTLRDATLVAMAQRLLDDAPPRFALAGVSMGGMVAMTVMTLAPERVTRLALFDTNARADTPEQRERRAAANAAMRATSDLPALAAPAIAYMLHPSTAQEVHDALTEMTVRVGVDTYVRQNEAVAARPDLLEQLGSIAVPTVVVLGADDLMTPPASARTIADAIAGATLHVIPTCGHLPPIEKPQESAALLRDWMQR